MQEYFLGYKINYRSVSERVCARTYQTQQPKQVAQVQCLENLLLFFCYVMVFLTKFTAD